MMDSIPNGFYRVSCKALILNHEGKFLLAQDYGLWELPGGGMDHGENHKLCIAREIQEEMGLKVKQVADHPSYFLTTIGDRDGIVRANIIYETILEDLAFTPSAECVRIGFFGAEDMPALDAFGSVKRFATMFDKDKHTSYFYRYN